MEEYVRPFAHLTFLGCLVQVWAVQVMLDASLRELDEAADYRMQVNGI